MKKTTYLFFILLFSLLSCKKELPELTDGSTDCECANKVSADFEIREILGFPGDVEFTTIETDDVLNGNTIYFKAKEENAEYTWYLGAEQEHTQQTNRSFPSNLIGSDVPITLVVRKNPNRICFPNDDGYDSITKLVHINSLQDSNIVEGVFRLAEKNSTDSIDITIDLVGRWENNIYFPDIKLGLAVSNFDGSGFGFDSSARHTVYRAYRGIRTSNGGVGFLEDIKHFWLSKLEVALNGVVEMNYVYRNSGSDWIYKNMKGRKL